MLQGTGSGSAVSIGISVTATLRSLRITGGSAEFGGGISNNGDLTLTQCTITGNTAGESGGGIFTEAGGVATLNDTSLVTRNEATLGLGSGGGIFNNGATTLHDDSSVVSNQPDNCGGSVGIANCSG